MTLVVEDREGKCVIGALKKRFARHGDQNRMGGSREWFFGESKANLGYCDRCLATVLVRRISGVGRWSITRSVPDGISDSGANSCLYFGGIITVDDGLYQIGYPYTARVIRLEGKG